MKSAMNMAKLRAIRENATVAVVFQIATNSYEIFVDNGAGGGAANNWVRDGGEIRLNLATLPAGVTMPEVVFNAATRFSFNGSGTSKCGRTCIHDQYKTRFPRDLAF